MGQQEKIYALRNISFWYDDEYYYPLWNGSDHIGHITAIFKNKEQAIQEWKRLEYEFTYHVDFNNFFETAEIIDFKEIGINNCDHINNLYCKELDEYLRSLNADGLFEFIHKADLHAYYLYEYPKHLKQSVSWDRTENYYEMTNATTEDDRTNNFIDASFIQNDPLLKEVIPPCNENRLAIFKLKGHLSELSDTPQILEKLIQNNPDIEYQNQDCLIVKPNAFISINSLLKDEFKILYLTIEEIYEIEKSLNQNNIKED